MSRQEIIAAAKAPTEAYNEKDWDAVRRSIGPGFVYEEVSTNRKAEGVEEVLELWQAWGGAFPDSRATFEEPLVDGDTVVLRLRWTGTHTGPLALPDGKVPPTGKSIDFRGCQVFRVEGGKAVAMAHYFDLLTMLSQIGAAPMLGADVASR